MSWQISNRTRHDGRDARADEALYGAQTQRAVENFPISGLRLPRAVHPGSGTDQGLRRACERHGPRVERAADEVAEGKYDDQFVVDVFQTGSGTSTNMNANEVIGHLAEAHPNDHVNHGQSSNDVIPTAIHVAAARWYPATHLLPAMRSLQAALRSEGSTSSTM